MQIPLLIIIISWCMKATVCVCVCVCGGSSGDCLCFIAPVLHSGGVHFTSYFWPRETSLEKATEGLTHCCTFKGQIAHIYATVCHCQEEWLQPLGTRGLCVYVCVKEMEQCEILEGTTLCIIFFVTLVLVWSFLSREATTDLWGGGVDTNIQ